MRRSRSIFGWQTIATTTLVVVVLGHMVVEPRVNDSRQRHASDAASPYPSPWGTRCFAALYSAAVAMRAGTNPYGHTRMSPDGKFGHALAEGAVSFSFPPLLQPPIGVLVYLPFAGVAFPLANTLHQLLTVLLVATACVVFVCTVSPGRALLATAAAFVWVLWMPVLHLIGTGQNTMFVLLALVAWLWAVHQSNRATLNHRVGQCLGGLALALCLVKPHMALIPGLFAAGYSLRQRRWTILLAAAIGGLAWVALTTAIAPDSWQQFRDYLAVHPPTTFYPVTLDGQLRRAFGETLGGVPIRAAGLTLWTLAAIAGGMVGWFTPPAESATAPRIDSQTMRVASPLVLRFALVCAASVVLCPHAFEYDFVLMLPALLVLLLAGTRGLHPIGMATCATIVLVGFGVCMTRQLDPAGLHAWYRTAAGDVEPWVWPAYLALALVAISPLKPMSRPALLAAFGWLIMAMYWVVSKRLFDFESNAWWIPLLAVSLYCFAAGDLRCRVESLPGHASPAAG